MTNNRSKTIHFLLVGILLVHASIFSAAESALSTNELLEEAIYLQEAKGDVKGAIEILEQIVASDTINRPLAAEAQYRLAVCKLEQGQTLQAVEGFENLVANYPNQSKWVEAALGHLPKEFSPDFIPWPMGERSIYEWRLPNGDFLGFQISTIVESSFDDISTVIVSNNSIMRGQRIIMETEIDQETFRPLKNIAHIGPMGKTTSVYSNNQVETHYEKNDNRTTTTIDSKILDNEQAILFLRQLTPEIGYKTHIKVYAAMIAQPIFIEVEIKAIETIETEIGSFEAYGVHLKLMGTEQTIWISTGDDRKVVRMEVGGTNGTLSDYRILEDVSTVRYPSDEFGYSINVPFDFHVLDQRITGSSNQRDGHFVRILSPTTKVSCHLQIKEQKLETNDPAEALAESARIALEDSRDHLKEFELLDEITDTTVNGYPAKYYVGKHVLNEKDERHFFRGIMRDGDKVFLFIGRVNPEDFETHRSTFESIFSSIRLIN